MHLDQLWLADFRSFSQAELTFPPGLLALVGDNGAGKTNILEAVGYLATLDSFRGATPEALVRVGAERAVVRGEGERQGRALLVEAEISRGRRRANLNHQPVRRSADLSGAFQASVFSPDDLALVKGGPSERRHYLDGILAALHPRHGAAYRDFERILRQRNALLAQVAARGGRLDGDTGPTLGVWDTRFARAGDSLGAARAELVASLEPEVAKSYAQLAAAVPTTDVRTNVALAYEAPWRPAGLAAALAAARPDELRRGVSLAGPHRDELSLAIGDLPARSHASQGEQRSLALALRLAAHQVVTDSIGEPPLLLLDDVFSELDALRARALVDLLPAGQSVLTTAGPIPAAVTPDRIVRLAGGRLVPV